jgi:PAS domain S-box-containing protein
MTTSREQPKQPSAPSPQQVEELIASPELARAVETEEFKWFLDHIPIAIVISRHIGDRQRIVYVNQAFAALTGQTIAGIEGKTWLALDTFKDEDEPQRGLGQAVLAGEDFLGTFRHDHGGKSGLVQAYASLIENEDGTENYRIVALVDVSERERSQREEFERQIRDKDLLLKELQHRVKNNLQLITALIRLEARSAKRGDNVDLDKLAARIESLSLLYDALSGDSWGPEVDLGNYIGQIAAAAMRSHAVEGVALDLKVSYCPASINVAMPAGLLVNELLTNAFKYAFAGRDGGTITVHCERKDEDHYRIVLADDGVGLPSGITWPARGKLGALILQTLRENTRHADFKLISTPGVGTRATIEFVHQPASSKAN